MILTILCIGFFALGIWQFCRAERHKAESRYFEKGWNSCSAHADEIYAELEKVRKNRNELREGMKELLRK